MNLFNFTLLGGLSGNVSHHIQDASSGRLVIWRSPFIDLWQVGDVTMWGDVGQSNMQVQLNRFIIISLSDYLAGWMTTFINEWSLSDILMSHVIGTEFKTDLHSTKQECFQNVIGLSKTKIICSVAVLAWCIAPLRSGFNP